MENSNESPEKRVSTASRVASLTIENGACFESITIPFNERVSVLLGSNGTGKTTLLLSIYDLLIFQASGTSHEHIYYPLTRNIDENTSISLVVKGQQETRELGLAYRKEQVSKVPDFKRKYSRGEQPVHLPIVFLTPSRSIKDVLIQGIIKEQTRNERWASHRSSFLKPLTEGGVEEIKQWIVNRYFFKKEEWGDSYSRELEHFIKNLTTLLPDDDKIDFQHVNKDMEPIFSTRTGSVPLGAFSSGFQSVIILFWEILNTYQLYYPKSDNIFLENGIVLIDELEVHLHPEWQRTILNGLRELFPNTQFIISTHSPLIASGCNPGEAIFLRFDEEKKAVLLDTDLPDNLRGWSADRLLTTIFGLSSTRDGKWDAKIEQFKSILANSAISGISDNDKVIIHNLIRDLDLPATDPVGVYLSSESLKKMLEK